MRKLWWMAVLALTGAIAVAQDCTVEGAFGAGTAVSEHSDRPNARFGLNVIHATCGDREFRAGAFCFEARVENRLVEIRMVRLTQLAVNAEHRVAEFAGHAVMTVRTREGVRHVRGLVRVRVQDNRPRDSDEGDPDTIAVAFFVPDRTDPVFAYRGTLARGDILVFRREH